MVDLYDPNYLAELSMDTEIVRLDFPERRALLALADAHLAEARRRQRERKKEKP